MMPVVGLEIAALVGFRNLSIVNSHIFPWDVLHPKKVGDVKLHIFQRTSLCSFMNNLAMRWGSET